ncbi:MAG: MFS transporter, partial [Anaerolineae bacterium]|nr:MFS transporter [Anaerolineae bacterium]
MARALLPTLPLHSPPPACAIPAFFYIIHTGTPSCLLPLRPQARYPMNLKRAKTFNYAVGMFGTSIPINMLKTYAAIYYVDQLGMTTPQLSLMLFIYTFIDAIDNPVYGFFSDRTHSRWGRRRPWL